MTISFIKYNNDVVDTHYKIVYFGIPFSGKWTNISYMCTHLGEPQMKVTRIYNEYENYVFWDGLTEKFSRGNRRFHIYTIPGSVLLNVALTRLLMGVDGIVFVVDSQDSRINENIECLGKVKNILKSLRKDINTIPIVFQYNKRDFSNALSVTNLNEKLNYRNWSVFESVATQGIGVVETFMRIRELVINN